MCCLLGPFARAMAIESGDAEYTFGGEPSPWQFQKKGSQSSQGTAGSSVAVSGVSF